MRMDDLPMNIFFTSDMHFGHAKIIEYSNRPFKNVNHMNQELIKRWNNRVNPQDVVYHIGDFSMKGVKNAIYWESKLNGKIVHIQGNHDRNNGVKTYIVKCIMHFGGKSIYCEHRPPHHSGDVPHGCDFMICGHVHEKWKFKKIDGYDGPIINVGTDVWNYEPVSVHSLLKYYRKLVNNDADFSARFAKK